MNDPILPDEPQDQAPQPPAAPDRMDRLEQAMAQLTATVADAANRLSVPPAPQAMPVRPPDVFLNDLAADPQGVIRQVAAETFREQADATLNPAVLMVLDATSKQLIQQHQFRVDSEFGAGTFDDVFRPQLERDLSQLRAVNPRATADPTTVEALVNRLYGGDNFHRLTERRQTVEKAHSRGLSHLIPGGGVPRLRQMTGDELPNDVEQFLRDVEKHTGDQIDRKRYAKVYYTGEESGPGRHRTSVVDYLKAVGASPDTLKMYGGGDRSA